MNLYRIANWEAQFETYETKKLADLKWVPTPNKHDGLGFRKIAHQKNRCELFAAWNLILQIASKGKKGERGTLQRAGKPLTPDDFELMTGFPAQIFEKAVSFFSSPDIGWLVSDNTSDTEKTAEPPVNLAEPPAEGKEWKGKKEGNKDGVFFDLIPEGLRAPEFLKAWQEWIDERKGKKNPVTSGAAKRQLAMLEKLGPENAVRSIDESISNGWKGLFEPRGVKAFPSNGHAKVKLIPQDDYIDQNLAKKQYIKNGGQQ